jgi:hypothetical protein
MYGRPTGSEHLLSLSGIFQPKENIKDSHVPMAIRQYHSDQKGISKVILHLDNDRAGRFAADALKAVIPKLAPGLSVISKPPRKTKDFNDYLRLIVNEKESVERVR